MHFRGRCDERIRLKRILVQALADHHDPMAEVTHVAKTGKRREFLRALCNAHKSKSITLTATEAYLTHITEHRCGRSFRLVYGQAA